MVGLKGLLTAELLLTWSLFLQTYCRPVEAADLNLDGRAQARMKLEALRQMFGRNFAVEGFR